MAWAIEGARKWAVSGLAIPGEVLDASKQYMSEQNDIELWVGERCQTGAGLRSKSSDLYQSFAAWKVRNGEVAGSSKTFSQRLERHYEKTKLNTGAHFAGLALRLDSGYDAPTVYEATNPFASQTPALSGFFYVCFLARQRKSDA